MNEPKNAVNNTDIESTEENHRVGKKDFLTHRLSSINENLML